MSASREEEPARPRADCAVLFLAGGKSRRMGRPKAWLEFEGRPLLAHLVERMRPLCEEIVVVAAPGQELPPVPARIVRDELPGEGPAGGLLTGLRAIDRPLAFVASCDVPFLDPAVAEYLLERAAGDPPNAGAAPAPSLPVDIVVPEWEGRLHPLQAVYRTTVVPLLAEQLAAGRRRPVELFDRVRTRVVGEAELRRIDPEGRTFLNMNTPEDYECARALWGRSRR